MFLVVFIVDRWTILTPVNKNGRGFYHVANIVLRLNLESSTLGFR